MTYATTVQQLNRRGLFRIQPGLERIQGVLRLVGNPHRWLPCIHIAGTNGKGSVASMLESILRSTGYRTGLYTSPHLCEVTERIQINRAPLSNDTFVQWSEKIEQAERKARVRLTYFEFATAIAFAVFYEKRIDVAILETGLGGKWDATNVVSSPLATVITSIDLDHMEWLGPNLSAIAREKAGIIKTRRPVICGAQGVACQMIRETAERMESPIHCLYRDFSVRSQQTNWEQAQQQILYQNSGGPHPFRINLLGPHQAENAALALATMDVLNQEGWRIPLPSLLEGLSRVQWTGRFQILRGSCPIIFDGAHNPAGVACLLQTLSLSPWKKSFKTFVVGFYADKDISAMASAIAQKADQVVLCAAPTSRASSPARLRRLFARANPRLSLIKAGRPRQAFETALRETPAGGAVIVTGSLAVIGEILRERKGEGKISPHA